MAPRVAARRRRKDYGNDWTQSATKIEKKKRFRCKCRVRQFTDVFASVLRPGRPRGWLS